MEFDDEHASNEILNLKPKGCRSAMISDSKQQANNTFKVATGEEGCY
jgi:hypothetical protein